MALRRLRVVPREMPPELLSRLAIVAGVMVVVVGLLVARLWFLQMVEGRELRALSENNRIRLWRVPAARGLVSDRYGTLLIDNRPSFDVVLVPEDTPDRSITVRMLAHYLDETREEIETRIKAPSRRPPYAGIVVRRDVGWDDVVALETHQLDLPGVSIQVRPRRFHPRGPLAAHLLGYVGEVSERDLADAPGDLRPGDYIGKTGLERVWDDELRGAVGGQQVEVDALGKRMRVLEEVLDVTGDTLVLTLDADLHDATARAMGERRGSCVALDPRDGQVLVMVSKPDYDPNMFARGIKHSEWQALLGDEARPLMNRAVHGQYAPGSIFKVAVAAGLLESNSITRQTSYQCRGGTKLGRRLFRCWRRGGHGSMDLHRAIKHSCDVFFYQSGQRLGVDGIAEYARRFGLGAPTGISLPNEAAGLIPTRAWKTRRFGEPWYPGETLPVVIGQGYVTVTPLQMANMVAMIANGGTHYRPQYVRRVEGPDGTVKREMTPDVLGYANVSPDVMEFVRHAMRDVVMAPGGTGRNGRVPGIEVAGKTGTAQVVRLRPNSRGNEGPLHTRDHAWFIAFAPVDAPEIAVACLAEHAGGGGGAIAAPIVSEILSHYFGRQQGPVMPPGYQHAHADRSTPPHTL